MKTLELIRYDEKLLFAIKGNKMSVMLIDVEFKSHNTTFHMDEFQFEEFKKYINYWFNNSNDKWYSEVELKNENCFGDIILHSQIEFGLNENDDIDEKNIEELFIEIKTEHIDSDFRKKQSINIDQNSINMLKEFLND